MSLFHNICSLDYHLYAGKSNGGQTFENAVDKQVTDFRCGGKNAMNGTGNFATDNYDTTNNFMYDYGLGLIPQFFDNVTPQAPQRDNQPQYPNNWFFPNDNILGTDVYMMANTAVPANGYTRIQNVLNRRFCVNGDCTNPPPVK